MKFMLELRDLCFSVPGDGKRIDILNHIDLTVPDGKLVVITGPNGSGKSTLARVIMGIEPATSGEIWLDGERVDGLNVTERARKGISYGFQQPPRFKGLRVRDLLELASGRQDLSHEEECQYLTRVGLCANDYIDREVDASLSGGEVKRIEIATILARSAGLMIFDEPEAGIDLWSFSRLTETFRQLHDEKSATLVVISHQERIIDLADEIVMVSGGVITQHGPKEEIFPQILANTVSGCSYMKEA